MGHVNGGIRLTMLALAERILTLGILHGQIELIPLFRLYYFRVIVSLLLSSFDLRGSESTSPLHLFFEQGWVHTVLQPIGPRLWN